MALDYARLLLQLKQASWAPPALAAALAETPAEQQHQHQQHAVIEDEAIVFSFGEPSASGAAKSVATVATEAVDGSVAAAAAIGGEVAVAVLGAEQEASLGLTYMYGEQQQQVASLDALQEHVSSLQGELQQQWGEVQERLNQQVGPEAGVGAVEAAGHWQVPHAAAQAMTLEERLAAQAAAAEVEARRQVGRASVGVCCGPPVSCFCARVVVWDAEMAETAGLVSCQARVGWLYVRVLPGIRALGVLPWCLLSRGCCPYQNASCMTRGNGLAI